MCLGNVLGCYSHRTSRPGGVTDHWAQPQKRKLLLPLVVSVVEPAHAFIMRLILRWLTSNEPVGQLP